MFVVGSHNFANQRDKITVKLCIVMKYDMIHFLTVIGLTPGGSSTVHIYTQTIQRTTQ